MDMGTEENGKTRALDRLLLFGWRDKPGIASIDGFARCSLLWRRFHVSKQTTAKGIPNSTNADGPDSKH